MRVTRAVTDAELRKEIMRVLSEGHDVTSDQLLALMSVRVPRDRLQRTLLGMVVFHMVHVEDDMVHRVPRYSRVRDEEICLVVMPAPPEGADWHARVVTFRSKTGKVTAMDECLKVLEVGRIQDVPWAISQSLDEWPQARSVEWEDAL